MSVELPNFTPMQKGLFKQLGGMLNRLVAPKRKTRLQELRKNLSNQEDGPTKQQQYDVLELLECQFNASQ